jgi:hypothetical protein
MGRPAFLPGKLFDRANVAVAEAFDEFEKQLGLFPIL